MNNWLKQVMKQKKEQAIKEVIDKESFRFNIYEEKKRN